MNIKEHKNYTLELTTEEVQFIDRIVKAKVGKYTLNEVLSTEWHICFDAYVDMFNALKKVYNRRLDTPKDYNEIRWLMNFLGDFYNGDCDDEDKAMALTLCDALENMYRGVC